MGKYESLKVLELQDIAKTKGLKGWSKLKKSELITFLEDPSKKYKPKTRYFSFFSGLTVEELHDFARENKIQGYSSLKKVKLIRFLDKQCSILLFVWWRKEEVKKSLRRLLFPYALRAWVGLFVSDKCIAEHFTQIILLTLNFSMREEEKRNDLMIDLGECLSTSDSDDDLSD